MFRTISIPLLVIYIAFSAPTWADDAQEIRDLITKENISCQKGDIVAIMSCYAPDYVMYIQSATNPDDILVAINGSNDLRTNYAEKGKDKLSLEIRHVSIKGDKAVAIARYLSNTPIGSHHTIWMVAKIEGKWLITSAIVTPTDFTEKTKTTEAKTILGQIIQLEKTFWNLNGSFVNFAPGANCPQIGFVQPINYRFTYSFKDSIATAAEIVDTNGDGAADDSLMLSVTMNKTAGKGTVGDPLSW